MKTVSVVIPVYNVGDCLERCLKSVLNQTLDNMEIIAVNDGSTDNSGEILDRYHQQYPSELKVFHKENGGMSDARNYGISFATGEYLAFVDSDDYVDKNMFQKMYKKAKENNYDVVTCDYWEVRDNKQKAYTSRVASDCVGIDEVRESMLEIYSSPWNKIYKKDLVCKTLFLKGRWYEDVEFLYRMFPLIKSIGVVRDNLYYYVMRKTSISHTAHQKIYDQIKNWNGLLKFYQNTDYSGLYSEEIEYCYVKYLLGIFIKSASKFNFTEFRAALKKALENVKINVPNYKNNKYIKRKTLKNLYLRFFVPLFAYLLFVMEKVKQMIQGNYK